MPFQDSLGNEVRRFTQTLNAIEWIWTNPCGASFQVMFNAALEPGGEFLLALLTPSWEEILEEYLHPRLGRGGLFPNNRWRRSGAKRQRGPRGGRRAGPRGALRRAPTKLFPDVDELIAHRLPGRKTFAARKVSTGEYLVWTAIDVADFVSFYFMLFHLSETFLMDWQSGIFKQSGCGQYPTIFFQSSGKWPLSDRHFSSIGMNIVVQQGTIGAGATAQVVPVGPNQRVICTGHAAGVYGCGVCGIGSVQLKVRMTQSGAPTLEDKIVIFFNKFDGFHPFDISVGLSGQGPCVVNILASMGGDVGLTGFTDINFTISSA